MVALKMIWDVVKNPKNLAIIVLLVLSVYFAYCKYNLQITYQQYIIAQKDAQLLMAENNKKAIDEMTVALKKNAVVTSKISEQIKPLKEGRTREKEYYDIANSIVDRFNSSLP
ncbi:MAG: hypothetical protein WC332_00590 [Clostridia bacterium]|jgi:cell division protein FtsB